MPAMHPLYPDHWPSGASQGKVAAVVGAPILRSVVAAANKILPGDNRVNSTLPQVHKLGVIPVALTAPSVFHRLFPQAINTAGDIIGNVINSGACFTASYKRRNACGS